ncbi:CidA/LrgA family protein [Burkholderia sp. Ac-20384]|uniref:CidA/LrgA family protein n=1 Tax=Burkholderia sp. Ac-20384 TaxID=2703902 RepID=UPI00197CBA86|nr:CidA/LrgA family protein [Burkholderia sp. Ac-20384]MBN3827522.1 CidA/LrgA family protein [Burkholderia sp. Ac-20384]
MLTAISTLLLFQFIGETLATITHVGVPGPLIGMLLLLAWLTVCGGPSPELDGLGRNLLSWLALLFVPAATGLVTGLELLEADWWRIALAISVSTALGLATTAWMMDRLTRLVHDGETSE